MIFDHKEIIIFFLSIFSFYDGYDYTINWQYFVFLIEFVEGTGSLFVKSVYINPERYFME
jgi:hypothetical protein